MSRVDTKQIWSELTQADQQLVRVCKKMLQKLLQNVQSIGKKKAQGMGVVESWIIEPTAQNYKGTRCFPVLNTGYKVDGFGRVYPSYHDYKNQQEWFYKQF